MTWKWMQGSAKTGTKPTDFAFWLLRSRRQKAKSVSWVPIYFWLLRMGTWMCPCRVRRERNPACKVGQETKSGIKSPGGGRIHGRARAGRAVKRGPARTVCSKTKPGHKFAGRKKNPAGCARAGNPTGDKSLTKPVFCRRPNRRLPVKWRRPSKAVRNAEKISIF